MTWDATLYAVRATPTRFPDDFAPVPMGPADEVRARIDACVPGVLWNGAMGRYSDGLCEAELVLWGEAAPESLGVVERVAVTALGNAHLGELLATLCHTHGWVAFDDAAGTLLELGTEPAPRDQLVDGKSGAAKRRHIRLTHGQHATPLGDADEVRRLIGRVLDVTHEEADMTLVSGGQHRIEFRVPRQGRIDALDVYAVGASAERTIQALCKALGWRAYDEETGWLP